MTKVGSSSAEVVDVASTAIEIIETIHSKQYVEYETAASSTTNMFETGSHGLVSQGQTLYQTQSKERVWSSEGGCTVPDPRITAGNA